MKRYLILVFLLSGCAWTDHHWDVPANGSPDDIKKVDLHNCQEDAFQIWRSNHDSTGEVLAMGAGGVLGGAIGGAAAGVAMSDTDSLQDFTKGYVKKCMNDRGY